MISKSFRVNLNSVLSLVASKLDLDKTRYQNAEEKYKAIGNWLNADNSALAKYSPQIYPQGSFLLGTVVKPLSGDEYDIDLVCLLSGISPDTRSQKVKEMVGDRLKESGRYSRIIEEKNRCWRLHYAREFHMDIIPAIPDTEKREDAILVPDRELTGWTWSNPKGYSAWFQGRMQALAEMREKGIEEVPDYYVKTVLQLAVQLMKRHRDIVFSKEPDNKPISIIITTLAARVFEEQGFQEDLFESLKILAGNMPSHIIEKNGEIWVTNPVNQDENFADKWNEHTELRESFYTWINKLNKDILNLAQCSSKNDCQVLLSEFFGEQVVSTALNIVQVDANTTVNTRFDVPHKKLPKWTMNIRGEVTVRGYIQHSNTNSEEFLNDSEPMDKHLSIYFLARPKNIDRPYEIQWRVVNTGKEAADAEQLRGGFYDSSSPMSHKRKESTLYRGNHWVEAFVIKDGICVARSGEFVVNIN